MQLDSFSWHYRSFKPPDVLVTAECSDIQEYPRVSENEFHVIPAWL